MGVGVIAPALFYTGSDMARRTYLGTHDVGIPIDYIMDFYGEHLDKILQKCASFAVTQMRKNAKRFEMLSLSGTMHYKWWNNTFRLRKTIKKKRGRFNRRQYIAGVFSPVAHLLEYGHVKWIHGKNTGQHVPAVPFIRPAEQTMIENLDAIIQSVLTGKRLVIGKK